MLNCDISGSDNRCEPLPEEDQQGAPRQGPAHVEVRREGRQGRRGQLLLRSDGGAGGRGGQEQGAPTR